MAPAGLDAFEAVVVEALPPASEMPAPAAPVETEAEPEAAAPAKSADRGPEPAETPTVRGPGEAESYSAPADPEPFLDSAPAPAEAPPEPPQAAAPPPAPLPAPAPPADAPQEPPMPIQIEMPRLSDTMEEGTLVKWRVKVGDKVSAQDVIADVETDKATMEVPVFDEGTIAKLSVEEGATVPVGDIMCVIAEEGEDVEAAASASGGEKKEAAAQPKESTEERAEDTSSDGGNDSIASSVDDSGKAASSGGGGRVKISPLARKLADEHGLDVNAIKGTGPGDRIIKRDVLEAAKGGGSAKASAPAKQETPAASAPAPKAVAAPSGVASHDVGPGLEAKTVQLSGMRKTIARRLVESKTQVPHFQVSVAVAMDQLMSLRGTINGQLKEQGVKISVNDFVMKAIAMSCVQHPVVNASFGGDEIVYHGSVNVGVAIALPIAADGTGGGLLVATVRDVQAKGLRAISNEVKTLAGKARKGGLSPQEMSDSTIAISNLGMPQYGVTSFSAIVNPPNAAIIAVGAALEKAVVRDGKLAVGLEMSVTLSGDHRVIDGAVAGEYLATLRSMLENPASLLV